MSSSFVPNNEHFLKRARNIRNELLNKTDRYILEDYPMTPDQKQIIKEYRQILRDFINLNKDRYLNGEILEIPKPPEFVNINIVY